MGESGAKELVKLGWSLDAAARRDDCATITYSSDHGIVRTYVPAGDLIGWERAFIPAGIKIENDMELPHDDYPACMVRSATWRVGDDLCCYVMRVAPGTWVEACDEAP